MIASKVSKAMPAECEGAALTMRVTCLQCVLIHLAMSLLEALCIFSRIAMNYQKVNRIGVLHG